MTLIISLISGILLILGIIVGTQNGNTMVNFYLLVWEFENISLTLLVIESIIVGIVLTIILSGVNTIKMKFQMRDILKDNRNLQKEVKALKNLPFEEGEGEEIEELIEEEEEEIAESKEKEEDTTE